MKTPQQKKRNDYAHSRVTSHFGRRVSRNKVFGNRQLRHAANQALHTQADDEALVLPAEPSIRNWSYGTPLAERIRTQQWRRIAREGHNCFRQGYNADSHARFRRVVESWIEGRTEYSAKLAEFYRDVLYDLDYSHYLAPRRDFLARFFQKEPELARRFKAWIDERAGLRR